MYPQSMFRAKIRFFLSETCHFTAIEVRRILHIGACIHSILHKHAHAIFHGYKNFNFQTKNQYIFLIFAQNIDFGYTLEPPH